MRRWDCIRSPQDGGAAVDTCSVYANAGRLASTSYRSRIIKQTQCSQMTYARSASALQWQRQQDASKPRDG
jgi:hypothetical protein